VSLKKSLSCSFESPRAFYLSQLEDWPLLRQHMTIISYRNAQLLLGRCATETLWKQRLYIDTVPSRKVGCISSSIQSIAPGEEVHTHSSVRTRPGLHSTELGPSTECASLKGLRSRLATDLGARVTDRRATESLFKRPPSRFQLPLFWGRRGTTGMMSFETQFHSHPALDFVHSVHTNDLNSRAPIA
jgi:hypothetical protein